MRHGRALLVPAKRRLVNTLARMFQHLIHQEWCVVHLVQSSGSVRLKCQHDHTHSWRLALRRHRASSPIVWTAAGLIQPSCRKRVSAQRQSRRVAYQRRAVWGAGGCCVVVSAVFITCPAHRSRQSAQDADVRRRARRASAHGGPRNRQPRQVRRRLALGAAAAASCERRESASS